tara:strand:+ start:5967 stop:6620 length:654 start_codon:yes stop_codon:yes gene_type:complete
MRYFLIMTLPLFILSCSALNNGKIAPGYFQAYELMKSIISDTNDEISWNKIEKIPYASILLRVGSSQEALLILESRINDSNIWISSDQIYIEEREGRVVKTAGLFNNLNGIFGNLSFIDTEEGNTEYRVYYYSFSNPNLENLEVFIKQTFIGKETIPLRSGERILNRYEEEFDSPSIGWKGKNIFWTDNKKKVIKSLQSITPKIQKLSIEEAKPYKG